jgi:hypothetical protein
MKEAVNALPIMKEVIEKVPLMEQVASETPGSGIVTNAMPPVNQGYQNMPMDRATTKRAPKGTYNPYPFNENISGLMNGYNPVRPIMGTTAKAPKAPKRPMMSKITKRPIGYPATIKTPRPQYFKNPIKLTLNTDETINNITGVQSQLSNSLLSQVNNILTNIGEQTVNTVMPNMSGGLSMMPKGMKKPMKKPKTMGLVAPGTKCPPCGSGTMRIAGTCQCAPVEKSPQEKLNNITNAINQNIDSISNGLAIISKYLPCAACPSCPPCESSNAEEPEEPESSNEELMDGGGRRSGTRRSRVKKSKKTLRYRRS